MITRERIIDSMARAIYVKRFASMGNREDALRYVERWENRKAEDHRGVTVWTRIDCLAEAEAAFDAGLELFASKMLCAFSKHPEKQHRLAVMDAIEELRDNG